MKGRKRIARLLAAAFVILLAVAAMEWYALGAARKAFDELMFQSALDAASVMVEACRTVYGFQVMREFDRESRLIYAAESVPDSIGPDEIEAIARAAQLPLVILTDMDGDILYRSSPPTADMYPWINNLKKNIPTVYGDSSESELFGIDRELPLEEGPKGLALRVKNGVLILFAPEPTIREREDLTLGRMIGRLGENPSVRYLALQDESGFIFATKSVERMSSLSADSFLVDVRESGEPNYRYVDFSGERVFEIAIVFPTMGRYRGVLRIGLSTKEYDHLLSGYSVQLGIILILVLIVAVGGVALILTARSLAVQKGLSDAILSEMNAACIAVDGDGSITLLNPLASRLFGLSERDVRGRGYSTVFPDDPLCLSEPMSGGSGHNVRIEIETSDGPRTLDVSSCRLPDGGAFAVAEDITDIVELKKEVVGAEHLRALGELAAGVAHEIRNPLNSIGIAAQRLAVEFEPTEDRAGYLELLRGLRSEIARLDNVVREFIGLSAPMAPKLVRRPLRPLLDEVVAAARLRVGGSGVEFRAILEEVGEAEFDEEQLKKALLNLLKNAVEATPSGGNIELRSSREGDSIKISVWDDGPPVPQKVMEALGKPFVSVGKERGSGIGLFVAFRIARDHGGRIEVETGADGTSFSLILPAV